MSFTKSLFLAIIATLLLTFMLGSSFINFFGVDVYMDDQLLEPLQTLSVAALLVVILVVIALAIVLSVFGSIIFVGMLIFGAILMVAVGVFWPVFLIAIVIWLCTKRDSQKSYQH